MNLCINCQHFLETKHTIHTFIQTFTLVSHKCLHRAKRSVVTGKADIDDYIYPPSYRAEISPIENKCGVEGKHFIPIVPQAETIKK